MAQQNYSENKLSVCTVRLRSLAVFTYTIKSSDHKCGLRPLFPSYLPVSCFEMTWHFPFCWEQEALPASTLLLNAWYDLNTQPIIGKNSLGIINYVGTDHDSVFHFWMYFSPQTMPSHLSSGLYGDV